jgi:hypothetical protein
MLRRFVVTYRVPVALLLAYSAGILGSVTANVLMARRVEAAAAQVVRGSRFELVDESGVARAFLEFERPGRPRLRIAAGAQSDEVDIGVTGLGQGYLVLNGRDGRRRFSVQMGYLNKPTLFMGDDESSSKVTLGSVQPDAFDPNLDFWALRFSRTMPDSTLGGVFVDIGHGGRPSRGSVSVRAADGKLWSLPSEGDNRKDR